MVLKIGESKTVKLPFWLKGVDITCEGNGILLLRQGDHAVLHIGNSKRNTVFAAAPLGRIKDLNEFGLTVKVHSASRWLLSVGSLRFVIDFGAKKAATNVLGLLILGSREWGENVQIPWRADFLPLFDLPMPSGDMDRNTAEVFWKWFHGSETDIVRLLGGSKKESRAVFRQVNLWLCPVFPCIKGKQIDFDLRCGDEKHLFILRHGGNERLAAEAAAFGEMMPQALADRWKFVIGE